MKKDIGTSGLELRITEDFSSNDDWCFERPAWDYDGCIQCGVCCLSCPDGAIFENGEGLYEADPRYCKGCGLCVKQCWTGCIRLEPVSERPPWLIKQ